MLTEHLKNILAEQNLTWQQCAEQANIPLETMRNLYYGKVKDPKVSTMLSLSRVLHVSINWLMGENIFSPAEYQLLTHYRICGTHGKSLLQKIAKYEACTALDEREATGKHSVPCIVPDLLTCDGSKYSTDNINEIYTTEPDAFMAVHVPNNNWAPRFCKHDIVLLKDKFPKHGEEALFTYQGEVYFRRYLEGEQNHILRCINGRYEDLTFKRMDDQSLVCIGTFTGIIRA